MIMRQDYNEKQLFGFKITRSLAYKVDFGGIGDFLEKD